MDTKNKKKVITVASDKGGVGKSTLAVLIVEYLNFKNIPVNLIDADPIETSKRWVLNCAQDGREVLSNNPDYLIVDTAGTSGAGLAWLNNANIIIVPFKPHYADISTVLLWFESISVNLQKKVVFVPNQYQKTNEQKDGLLQVKKVLDTENAGTLLPFLSNRPAIYGSLLNGSNINFFRQYSEEIFLAETKNLMNSLISGLSEAK